MPVTLRSRATSTATGRVIERVMTKAIAADSASATAMTIQIVCCPAAALAAVALRARRLSASRPRASVPRAASSCASAGVTAPT